jgi:hypothetical protein|tara:strand:+ start:901 stop:1140 length:240 start_codon:yes stop_codon:yes gene_type:complete
MNDLYNATGTITWVISTSIGILEWFGGIEVNSVLTSGSLLLALVYGVYRIKTQRLDLKLKQNEYAQIENKEDGDEKNKN